jgi:hypothetical protein
MTREIIDLVKGRDYHEVESEGARDQASPKAQPGAGAERVTRLERGSIIIELSLADIEARVIAALRSKARESTEPRTPR